VNNTENNKDIDIEDMHVSMIKSSSIGLKSLIEIINDYDSKIANLYKKKIEHDKLQSLILEREKYVKLVKSSPYFMLIKTNNSIGVMKVFKFKERDLYEESQKARDRIINNLYSWLREKSFGIIR